MSCKFLSSCSLIIPNLKCDHSIESHKCQLRKLKSNNILIKNPKLNEGSKRIISEDIDTSLITCPRCVRTETRINGFCTNSDCSFYTKKLSYNCFIIHSNLFYPDTSYPGRKIIELACELTPRSYARLLELSLFNMRICTIIVKYLTEYLDDKNSALSFYTKEIHKIMQSQKFDTICGICGTPRITLDPCECITNPSLREERLQFQTKWKSFLERAHYDLPKNLFEMKPKDIAKELGEELYTLKFTRFLLKDIQVEGVKFTDLPFGYVFNSFRQLFTEAPWKASENLGLTDKVFEKAFQLYNIA